jgi:dTMP kinase
MFLTFEGLDYSGKTTQAKMLVERLQQQGDQVVLLREPGGTIISEKIREILLDKQNHDLTQAAELFLFSAARTQLVREIIQPALKANKIVVCDRFYDSTTAYQGYGRGVNLDGVHAINRIATLGISPTITFFIDISIDEIFRRQVTAGITSDRMESAGKDFFERVRNGYWKLAENEARRVIVVNGQRPVQEIHEEIWDLIQKHGHKNSDAFNN